MRFLYTTWVFSMYIFGLHEGLWQLFKLTLHEMPLHYLAFFEGIFDLKLSGSCSSLHYMRLLYTSWVFRMFIFGLNEGLWQLLKLTLHEMPLNYMAFFEGIFDLKPSDSWSILHYMRLLYTT